MLDSSCHDLDAEGESSVSSPDVCSLHIIRGHSLFCTGTSGFKAPVSTVPATNAGALAKSSAGLKIHLRQTSISQSTFLPCLHGLLSLFANCIHLWSASHCYLHTLVDLSISLLLRVIPSSKQPSS